MALGNVRQKLCLANAKETLASAVDQNVSLRQRKSAQRKAEYARRNATIRKSRYKTVARAKNASAALPNPRNVPRRNVPTALANVWPRGRTARALFRVAKNAGLKSRRKES